MQDTTEVKEFVVVVDTHMLSQSRIKERVQMARDYAMHKHGGDALDAATIGDFIIHPFYTIVRVR